MFREPLKARIILAFGIGLSAALAFERLSTNAARRPPSRASAIAFPTLARWSAVAILLAAWGVVAFFLYASYPVDLLLNTSSSPLSPEVATAWQAARKNPRLLADTLLPAAAGVTLVLLAFLLALASIRRRPRPALAACLLLAAAEPLAWHIRFLYSTQPYLPRCGLPEDVALFLETQIAQTRAEGGAPWRVTFPNPWINRSYYLDNLLETGGYDPLMPAYANSRGAIKGSATLSDLRVLREPIAQALGRRFNFLDCPTGPGAPRPHLESFRDTDTASIAHITRNVRVAHLPLGTFGPDIDGLNDVLPGEPRYVFAEVAPSDVSEDFHRRIEAIAHVDPPTTNSDESPRETDADSIRMRTQRAPQRYEFDVRLRAPALFILRATWLPGWRVRVDDGPPLPPWHVNRWSLGAPVPEGRHRVVFEYRPVHFTLSLWTALAAWLLVAIGLLAARRLAKPSPKTSV
jgi:hypothetical protein